MPNSEFPIADDLHSETEVTTNSQGVSAMPVPLKLPTICRDGLNWIVTRFINAFRSSQGMINSIFVFGFLVTTLFFPEIIEGFPPRSFSRAFVPKPPITRYYPPPKLELPISYFPKPYSPKPFTPSSLHLGDFVAKSPDLRRYTSNTINPNWWVSRSPVLDRQSIETIKLSSELFKFPQQLEPTHVERPTAPEKPNNVVPKTVKRSFKRESPVVKSKVRSPFESFVGYAKDVIGESTESSSEKHQAIVCKYGDEIFVASNRLGDSPRRHTLESAQQNLLSLASNGTKVVLDQGLFDSRGTCVLDLTGISRPFVLMEGRPPPLEAVRLHPARGPPAHWAARWTQHMLVRVEPNARPSSLLKRLEQEPFHRSELKILSLFITTSVEAALTKSKLRNNQVTLAEKSNDAVRQAFLSNPGGTIVLLGHVEHSKFVTRSTDGSQILIDLPISTIEEFAKESRSNVIYLGCNAGVDVSVGADRAFNPIYAIERIEAARESTSMSKFLEKFCSATLGLVLDESAFVQSHRKVELTALAPTFDYPKESEVNNDVSLGPLSDLRPSLEGEVGWLGVIPRGGWPVFSSKGPAGWQPPYESKKVKSPNSNVPWAFIFPSAIVLLSLSLYLASQRRIA